MAARFWMLVIQSRAASIVVQRGGSYPGESPSIITDIQIWHIITQFILSDLDLFNDETVCLLAPNDQKVFQEKIFPATHDKQFSFSIRMHETTVLFINYRKGVCRCTHQSDICSLYFIIQYPSEADRCCAFQPQQSALIGFEAFSKAFMLRWNVMWNPVADCINIIEESAAAESFRGFSVSVFYGRWNWKAFPVDSQVLISTRKGEPESRVELICNQDLWHWSNELRLQETCNCLKPWTRQRFCETLDSPQNRRIIGVRDRRRLLYIPKFSRME